MAPLFYQEVNANHSIPGISKADIDNELRTLHERMRALRTQRNIFSPICSIPPEVLGAIFVHISREIRALYAPDDPAVLSWLNVGHVCRHWREIALATPELWATLFLNSSKCTDAMLTRSKMAPLILRTGNRYRMDCVQKAFVHVGRLQEISLRFANGGATYCHILDLLRKLSSHFAPSLQSLSLDGEPARKPRIALPASFLAPNLRKLHINHCDLLWASPILSGLTVLDIRAVSAECLPTLDELISTLHRMPALHTLALDGALPTVPRLAKLPPDALQSMNVQLPHLRRLRLVGKMLEVANVLACIELPDSTSLEIQLRLQVPSSDNPVREWNLSLPIFSRALERCFTANPAKSRRLPRSMRLFANDHIRLQYSMARHPSWVGSTSEVPLEWTAECPVTLDLSFPGEASKKILRSLWKLVPLGGIESLYVEGYLHPYWDGFWYDVLGPGSSSNLAYIHLRGSSQLFEDLLISMRSRKHSVSRCVDRRAFKGPVFSPALSHLVLEYLEFNAFCITWTKPSDLLDVLIDRANECRDLDKLTITACMGISARDLQMLGEVVTNVEWDEFENPVGDGWDYSSGYDPLDDGEYNFYSDGDYSS